MSYDIGIRFLDLFQDNKSLGRDDNDVTTVGTSEDYFPMDQILAGYGQRLRDFTNESDALEAGRHLCAKNCAEHHYEMKPEMLDEKCPAPNGFCAVMSMGKTLEHAQTVSKNQEQQVDLKNPAQLQQAQLFVEGLGLNTERPTSSVQVEHTKADGLEKKE